MAAKIVAPMTIGALPFAIITGAVTVNAGISPANSFLMSILISAGASQVAAIDLIVKNSPIIVVVLTGLMINLRLVMYSASIAPYLQGAGFWKKFLLSFILFDQSYAVSIMEFSRPDTTVHKTSFYLGASLTVLFIWQIGIIIGILLGNSIPASWSLDFAVPLTFLFLLITVLKGKPMLLAAVAATFVSVGAGGLPFNLNIILGAIAGIGMGYWAERSRKNA